MNPKRDFVLSEFQKLKAPPPKGATLLVLSLSVSALFEHAHTQVFDHYAAFLLRALMEASFLSGTTPP